VLFSLLKLGFVLPSSELICQLFGHLLRPGEIGSEDLLSCHIFRMVIPWLLRYFLVNHTNADGVHGELSKILVPG